MTDHDEHVQHTWNLANVDGDQIAIELLTDDETVRVDGGDGEDLTVWNARRVIEEQLLPKYTAAGYQITSSYAVNDPATGDDDETEGGEPDGRPAACPECGSPVEYVANHVSDFREGEAWMCTECRWGQYLTA
jgi:hypothetical protein